MLTENDARHVLSLIKRAIAGALPSKEEIKEMVLETIREAAEELDADDTPANDETEEAETPEA